MVKRAASTKHEKVIHTSHSASLPLYRRIVLTFAVLVAAMLVVVLYVLTVQATILVTPVQKEISSEFLVGAVLIPTREQEVRAIIRSGSLGRTQTFTASGEGGQIVEEKAYGTVTLHNTSSRAQPLVATTRLLSQEGALFRLDRSVTVPAQGTVEASVHADLVGVSGEISPTRLTIPGLAQSRQAEVFATSAEVFTGGTTTKKAISEQEILSAKNTLQAALVSDAESMLREQVEDELHSEVFSIEVESVDVSVEPLTSAESFDVTMSIKVVGVFYDRVALETIAKRQLYQGLGDGQDFFVINTQGMQVDVDRVDEATSHATLRVVLVGRAITSQTSEALDPARFIGMSQKEVTSLLLDSGVATAVDVNFFPFWVRHVPRLVDRVSVKLQAP